MIEREQAVAVDVAIEAREWLDSQRSALIHELHSIQLHIDSYKGAASDAAMNGVRVRESETLQQAMNDVMCSLAALNADLGEWSS
jgi:hypothetical protein